MTETATHRDVTAILADLADFTVASTGAKAATLYHELEAAVRTQLAPLPEGEAERLAEAAEQAARTMAPPVPGVTAHCGYTFSSVVHVNDRCEGLLATWLVAGSDEDGRWVTWQASDQAGRLVYHLGHYFDGADPIANRRDAMRDLADRAGILHRPSEDEVGRLRGLLADILANARQDVVYATDITDLTRQVERLLTLLR